MAERKVYSDFGKLIRIIVSSMYKDGEIQEELDTVALRVELSEDGLRVIRKIVKLIMTPGFISKTTQLYISTPGITYNDIGNMLQKEANQIKGKVWSDMKKIRDIIGDDTLNKILYYNDEEVIARCEKVLNKELSELVDSSLLDNFVIDLRTDIERSEVSEEDFEYALDSLRQYTEGYVSLMIRGLGKEILGYINYLVYNEDILDEKDRDRLKKLKEII